MAAHLTICICHGVKKHMLLVREDTTVEELAVMVCVEVLHEQPPEIEGPLCSVIKFIFRGRPLSTPDLTMGALRVKNGERIMVLPRLDTVSSNYSDNQKPSESIQDRLQPKQPSELMSDSNGCSVGRVLEKLSEETERCEARVRQLNGDLRTIGWAISNISSSRSGDIKEDLQQQLKTAAACNEEHMKLLLQLDAVQTEGDTSLRAQRKDLVVRVQHSLELLDELTSAAKHGRSREN